ncbi:hypothetical protein V4251_000818 [Serratia marcescens]
MTLTTERQQFEEWFNEEMVLHISASNETVVRLMWKAWQASRELLANREAQPVAWTVGGFATHDKKWAERRSAEDNLLLEPLYRHPVVTGIDENHYDPELEPGLYVAEIMTKGGAAVINGYYTVPPAPAVSDDTRRMDWLVAHHVTVRKPLRYGSEAMFTAQTITDEEDDYHATKLREQIDAAMLAAAPGDRDGDGDGDADGDGDGDGDGA